MKPALARLLVFGLIAVLGADESFGQRGGRGGGRGGPGPARGGAGPHIAPASKPSPGRMGGPGGPGSPGPRGGDRPGVPGPRGDAAGVERFLGVTGSGSRTATPARQAVGHWNELPYQPFTPAWYAAHPNVWQATHPHADLFVAATAAGLAGWLAVPYAAISTSTYSSGGSGESAVASEEPTSAQEPSPTDPAEAGAAAEQWMPLGVFALRANDEPKANLVIQMAVNRDGILRGSHFDTSAQKAENVSGSIDKQSLRAVWRSVDHREVAFETTLGELTRAEGTLVVRFSDGQRETWKLIQISR